MSVLSHVGCLVLGGVIGVFVTCCCVVAGRSDRND